MSARSCGTCERLPIFLVPVCQDGELSFNEFGFLRIHKLLVNTNIDDLVKSQINDYICRAKPK